MWDPDPTDSTDLADYAYLVREADAPRRALVPSPAAQVGNPGVVITRLRARGYRPSRRGVAVAAVTRATRARLSLA